jgi:hypothetical protein
MKLLVIITFGDKALSIIQTNCNIKAVKDEKMSKRTDHVVVAIAATV